MLILFFSKFSVLKPCAVEKPGIANKTEHEKKELINKYKNKDKSDRYNYYNNKRSVSDSVENNEEQPDNLFIRRSNLIESVSSKRKNKRQLYVVSKTFVYTK